MSATKRALGALAIVVACIAIAVQVAVDGLYGSLAAPHSLPHLVAGDWPFGLASATGLDRFGVVRVTLARAAIVRNEPARATALLAPLPASDDVSDLRGRADLAAGDAQAALTEFARAADFVAAEAPLDALAAHDPRAALALVRAFETQLAARASEPEIGAEAAFREGVIAAGAAVSFPAQRAAFDAEALDAFARALARAPNEEKYLLNDAFAALRSGDAARSRSAYERAAQVVPDSVDAFVGVAAASAVQGDCARSTAAYARARTFAAEQGRVADAAAAGYDPPVLAAIARCR